MILNISKMPSRRELSSNFRPESMKSDFIGGRVSYRGIGVE